MSYETILLEKRGAVGLITLNRPARLNAMNKQMLVELQAACDELERDAAIRAVVLSGAGKAFCAGFDLQDQAAAPPRGKAEWQPVLERDFNAVMRFWHLTKPTIAAVSGAALAGGCELALACDITIAGKTARFGEPELKFGAGIVVMLLPWLTGPKQAKEVLLTGNDNIDASEALRLGLINRVVADGGELTAALSMAEHLAIIDPMVMQRTKAAINESYRLAGMDKALEAALQADLEIEGEGSGDKREFLEILRQGGLRAALAWRDKRFS